MERARQFVSAILAGFLIGMGGTVFLSNSNTVVGAFLFAIGLLTVVVFKLNLYTGKIGYLPREKPIYLLELLITWAGNLCGAFLMAKCVQYSRIYANMERVQTIVEAKLSDNFLSLFLLAVLCGLLMFIAVDTFRNVEGSTIRVMAVFVSVMVFILSGFEHVIANMFYFSLADAWSGHTIMAVLVMTLGNSVGGMLIPLYQKIFHVSYT